MKLQMGPSGWIIFLKDCSGSVILDIPTFFDLTFLTFGERVLLCREIMLSESYSLVQQRIIPT